MRVYFFAKMVYLGELQQLQPDKLYCAPAISFSGKSFVLSL